MEGSFQTRLAVVDYPDEKTLSAFLWRISGTRFRFPEDLNLAQSRVDGLIERVQAILDIYPANFKLHIKLYPVYEEGNIAAYIPESRAVKVYADKVTDGILAHEVAHAVMDYYFSGSPPKKVQEILAQYVDRHLWEDY